MPTKYKYPYIHAAGDGGKRTRTQLIVIHATDNNASAKNEAGYASHRPDRVSAHFYIDDTSVYQSLLTDHVAYGCYPEGNSRSIQLELCGRSNHLSGNTQKRAALVVARLCVDNNIPVKKVSPAQARAGVKGICGHGDVTRAWGQGDHTDPGSSFNWAGFVKLVQTEVNRIQGVKPVVKPPVVKPAVNTYKVRSGDTLSGIAEKHKITLDRLLALNPKYKSHPDDINVGDTLKVK